MRALILELIQTLPGVQLSGFERGRRRLSQALYAGTIDFAVLSGDLVLEAMTRKALWAERIMIALPQDHPLLVKDRLHWVDLRAVCRQHEIDQLNGLFWINRMSHLKRERLIKRFEKVSRRP
jgi:DNA-binding transcriptional LysR family regulator